MENLADGKPHISSMISQDVSNTLPKKNVFVTCRSTAHLSDAMTDTDSYLTAEDETESSSEDDSDEESTTGVVRVKTSDQRACVMSNYEHNDTEVLGCNERTLGKTTVRRRSAASVESSLVESEPRRRSYQFAIDEFSDVILNDGGHHGNDSADDCKEEEVEIPDDLDPAEFNHRKSKYPTSTDSRFPDEGVQPTGDCYSCRENLKDDICCHTECFIDLDPVEFKHPRHPAGAKRNEGVSGSSTLSSVVVNIPTSVLQVNHSEWIVSRPATRSKLYLTEEGEERQLGALPAPVEDEEQSESDDGTSERDGSMEEIVETEQLCRLKWPVVEATVNETMEIICATLVDAVHCDDDGFVGDGQDAFESSATDVGVGSSFDVPTPDYSSSSSSSNESYHSDPNIEEEQASAGEHSSEQKTTCLSEPTTPDPDYDVLSPVSPMREQLWPDEFALDAQTRVSQNLFNFESVNLSESIEMEEEKAIQTPLDRKVSLRKSRYKRRAVQPKTHPASVLPRVDDEEMAGMNENTDTEEVTHFGKEVCEDVSKNALPSVYDSGPVGVPVVLTRHERELYGRPSVVASADLSGATALKDEGLRPVTELNNLAKKTRKNGKRKKIHSSTQSSVDQDRQKAGDDHIIGTESMALLLDHHMKMAMLRRDPSGFGMSIGGYSPVQIVRVAENGAAMKAGVKAGDKIIKVNGTFVTNWGYEQVMDLIKGAGPFVRLDVLRHNELPVLQDALQRRDTSAADSSWMYENRTQYSTSPNQSMTVDGIPNSSAVANDSPFQDHSGIMAMESDDEDEEDNHNFRSLELSNQTEFSNINVLKQKPAHMAVFLSYVLGSHKNSSSLLFTLVTDGYAVGNNVKEISRWAQEIYYTFLAESAPLKIPVDSDLISSVEAIITQNRLEKEANIFQPMLKLIRSDLETSLAEFRQTRSLGLQGLYGGEMLRSNMDRQDELKIVEAALWHHFVSYFRDDSDQSQALAIVIATYLKSVGFNPDVKNVAMLESCPTFNTKDKKAFWLKAKKGETVQGHQFIQSSGVISIPCVQCSNMVWNAFNTGFQCQYCQVKVHKTCKDKLRSQCNGREKNRGRAMTFNFMPNKLASALQPTKSLNINDRPSDAKTLEESGTFGDSLRQQSVSTPGVSSHLWSNASSFVDLRPSISSSTGSLSKSSSTGSRQTSFRSTDPDLDVEPDLPPLDVIIPKDQYVKLKGSEKKQQQVIHELFYTERKHVSMLKIIYYFYQRMSEETWIPSEFVQQLFPSIEELVDVHVSLSNDCKARVSESAVVHNVADLLLKRFSGESGEQFAKVCAEFICDQKYVLSELRLRLSKDQRLAAFLQELKVESGQRLDLKDFLPYEMQRITRYPLLIDRLIKATPANTEEHEQLAGVLPMLELIARTVNEAVSECENKHKANDMERKLDRRASDVSVMSEFKNRRLTDRKLIRDGDLAWRLGSGKQVTVHAALFADIIVLLQSQEDKLVLRSHNIVLAGKQKVPHSPVIKLKGLMVKANAAEKRAFFLINLQKASAQYALVANSAEEKANWIKDIGNAISMSQRQLPVTSSPSIIQMMAAPFDLLDGTLDNSAAPLDTVLDSSADGSQIVDAIEISNVEVERLTNAPASSDEFSSERRLSKESVGHPRTDELQQAVTSLHQLLNEKRLLVLQSLNLPDTDVDELPKAEEVGDESLTALAHLQKLLETADLESSEYQGCDQSDSLMRLSADRLVSISNGLHQLVVQLTETARSTDEENSQLQSELRLARDRLQRLANGSSPTKKSKSPVNSLKTKDREPADCPSESEEDQE